MQLFCPRTRPKTFLQYFSSEQRKFKAKHCGRNKKFIKLRKYKKNVGMHVRANLNKSEKKKKFEKGGFQAKIQLVKVLVHVSIVKQDLHNKKYVGFERFMFWVLKFWASKECTLMLRCYSICHEVFTFLLVASGHTVFWASKTNTEKLAVCSGSMKLFTLEKQS